MSNFNERIAGLSPEKRILLERRLLKNPPSFIGQQEIRRRGTTDPCTVSFAQERLWFLDQLEPGNSAYNISRAVRLTGDLKVAALEQSFTELVRRHEVLRTTFVVENDRPVQMIAHPGPFTFPFMDLSALPEEQREMRVRELVSEEAFRPFDLARGPLLRAGLLRLAPEEHVLLVTMHHIISDGWSMGIFYRELSALYEAFSRGKQSPLPELPIQYADFAVWQREWLQGERLEDQLSYWEKQLAGDLPVVDLPADYLRPAAQTHRGGSCSLKLSGGLTGSLNALSQRTGKTLFMIMLAAFNLLLHRLSAQDDIIVGTPIAGRNRLETEGLIGFFVNTMVMRTDLSGSPTFLDLLGRVAEVAVDAYTNQDVPFEKLVEKLQPERDLSRTPLFQVMLNMLNLAYEPFGLADLRVEIISPGEEDSKFDLTLYVARNDDGMLLDLVYNADLFEGLKMTEMLEQMRYLLEQVAEDPEKSVSSYSLRTPGSAHFLPDPGAPLHEPDYPSVASMFLLHVDRMPNYPAVSHNGKIWTYRQLSESVYHLAGVLRNHGIGKGDVIGVTGPRSFGIIAGTAAVLLSGRVLLTIDQDLPAGRKRLMCQEAKAKCLLQIVDRRQDSLWSEDLFPSGRVSVDRDTGLAVDAGKSFGFAQADLPELSPDDAAYIFFTSGTTGVPKGVLGCHKGLSHFLTWQRDTFSIGPLDRCAQLTNLSFDVVLRDIFLPLVSGATLCLPDESEGPTSDRVLSWLDREGITLLHTVPSVAQSWLKSLTEGVTLHTLGCIFFAGEPLTEALVQKWREAFPRSGQIVNLYGPTETTLAKCFYEVPSAMQPGVQPVGRTLPHTQALVLSENLAECGVSEPGEIFLRTPYRTLGYINAHDEQEERFQKNPFRNDPQDILYRTGDRGRYRCDGLVEVLGRLDDQVKIRGVRVEPAEVTAVLSRQSEVSSSVVIGSRNSEGESILTAYVVPASPGGISASGLRSSLSSQLPAAMVPSHFVVLDALPLTRNGKVDKRALPVPDIDRPDTKEVFIAPRTPLEESLASMWCQVLGLERVGMRDNFFELGGHSLIATQMVSRIRRDLDCQITVRGIFEYPTIELLALHLIEKEATDPEFEAMDALLNQVETMSDCAAESLLAQGDLPGRGDDNGNGERTFPPSSPFSCPRNRSELFGRHECNLLMVINEEFDLSKFSSFESVAQYVRELDPSINVAVVRDRTPMNLNLPKRPTLIFSPAFIRNYPPVKGRIFCGQPLSKSEEYAALEKAGIPVPLWALLTEEETPDLSKFDDYVVRKPNNGGKGAKVVVVRKNRVRWKPIVTGSAGLSLSSIIQQFIYTGPWPVSYRVNTLFGKVLYSNKFASSGDGPGLAGPRDFKSAERHDGVSIVANAKGSRVELNYDEEIIRLAESAHAAFPDVPLLGFDIVREVPSGKLFVMEANAIGYVWQLNTTEYGILVEEQFDGARKAAYILAEKTQQIACQSSSDINPSRNREYQTAEADKNHPESDLRPGGGGRES